MMLLKGSELDGIIVEDKMSHDDKLKLSRQVLESGPVCLSRFVSRGFRMIVQFE